MSIEVEELQLAKDRIRFQKVAVERDVWQTCLNCHHWGGNDPAKPNRPPGCGKWNRYPPAEVLVHGCPDWLDRVPF